MNYRKNGRGKNRIRTIETELELNKSKSNQYATMSPQLYSAK